MKSLDIRTAPSVERWRSSASHHLDDPGAQEERLRILEAFCEHVGKSPDELVAFCFLRKKDTGKRFVSVKRRVTVNEWIDTFVAAQGWQGKEAVSKANVVRSFLIHNGVLIQGSVWRG
ncbi:hypothetical protein ACFS2C_22190 [Prauserella oleivorans]|uniref:Uncharacterized protein n=1 Tax=Prauserella oleivorans TaxID=1478153 RepID=A0ABW5WHT4_9PSEU